jgi:hypothetical protein
MAQGAAAHPATRPAPQAAADNATIALFDPATADDRLVVFVCDGGGPMIQQLATLRSEILRSVQALRPDQSFDVIYVSEGGSAVAFGAAGAVPATAEAKRRLGAFLAGRSVPFGGDPVRALKAAFASRPSVVHVVTDGSFVDNDLVLRTVRELNRPGPGNAAARVNAVLFADDGDADPAAAVCLEALAGGNGGRYRHVSEANLRPADGAGSRPATRRLFAVVSLATSVVAVAFASAGCRPAAPAAAAGSTWVVVMRHGPGRGADREADWETLIAALRRAGLGFQTTGGLGGGYTLSVLAEDVARWEQLVDGLFAAGALRAYARRGPDRDGFAFLRVIP